MNQQLQETNRMKKQPMNRNRRKRTVAAGLILTSAALLSLVGYSAIANSQIDTIREELTGKTLVPIVLPAKSPTDFAQVSSADPEGYLVLFNRAADCAQFGYGCTVTALIGRSSANAYPMGSNGVSVELDNGIEAYFFASDDPDAMSFLKWEVDGYRYELSTIDHDLEQLMELANSAY